MFTRRVRMDMNESMALAMKHQRIQREDLVDNEVKVAARAEMLRIVKAPMRPCCSIRSNIGQA